MKNSVKFNTEIWPKKYCISINTVLAENTYLTALSMMAQDF